jgi:pyrimidine-specific ribonucleoside hydrolase
VTGVPMAIDVVLDVDTGIDDAMAIVLAFASPALRVRAITCVAGNVEVDQVLINTLAVLDHIDAPDVPVTRGASGPLDGRPYEPRGAHGSNGLGGLRLGAPRRRAADRSAAEVLRDVADAAAAPVTMIALGPLTNVAALLQATPPVIDELARVVVVGDGTARGTTPRADFNMTHDPVATGAVFASGVPTQTYGADRLASVALSTAQVERLARSSRPPARLLAALAHAQAARFGGRALLGDAGAVATLVAPAVGDLTEWVVRTVDPGAAGADSCDRP